MSARNLSKIGSDLVRRCETRDPFSIAQQIGVEVMFCQDLASLKGMYRVIKRNRFIIINDDLNERMKRINYLFRISLCGIIRVRLFRNRIYRIGIFRMRFFHVRQNLLRLFINLKDHTAHPAVCISFLMADEIAVLFEFAKSGENRVRSLLADGSETAGGELPAVIE